MNNNGFKSPVDVGIIDIQAYFPIYYVDQNDLEDFDNVGKGKYSQGLGQDKMAITTDREDINSICLTVLDKLLQRNSLDRKHIGRLEVGTETFLDKSKSVKTYLMSLFKDSNTDIEGVTTSNACYGGTNAFFNTINWIQSESWDGRYGIVVMGDIAVYGKGNARPTGGCGALAILIGSEAPIIIDPIRSSYMNNVYDFFKPDPQSEYPEVDGQFSVDCYIKALESCYLGYMNKMLKKSDKYVSNLNDFDFFCFHSPFAKMVEKAFIHLVSFEIKRTENYQKESEITSNLFSLFEENSSSLISSILQSNDFKLNNEGFNELKNILQQRKVLKDFLSPSLALSKSLGNTYVCSLYMNFLSLIVDENINLNDKRILMFSYGSGCASSMFSLRIKGDYSNIRKRNFDLLENLMNRVKVHPADFEQQMKRKEKLYLINNYTPESDVSLLRDGTYYLTRVDDRWRRYYSKKTSCCHGMEMSFNQLSNHQAFERLKMLRNQIIATNSKI